VSFRDFSLAIWKEYGHIPPYEIRIPVSIALAIAYFAELSACITGKTPALQRGGIKEITKSRYVNCDKARKILGYRAQVGLVDGIKRSVGNFQSPL
jgi:sterol-4alpha-carboxylate 3-dehydrogenase (decarboxylating)